MTRSLQKHAPRLPGRDRVGLGERVHGSERQGVGEREKGGRCGGMLLIDLVRRLGFSFELSGAPSGICLSPPCLEREKEKEERERKHERKRTR